MRQHQHALSTVVGCRYDVELYQRIEKLIGQKLEEFGTEQELVLLLLERVSEAQRMATMQVCPAQAMHGHSNTGILGTKGVLPPGGGGGGVFKPMSVGAS